MEGTSWNVHHERYLMELTSSKLPKGAHTMEVTSWNLHHRYLMELTPWIVLHGMYTMEDSSWNLHHRSYLVERTPWKLPQGT